jgi:hypothetical protein
MNAFIIGWLFLLAAWFPKPFIKDEQSRNVINLALSAIALVVFICDLIILLNLLNK